MAKQQKVVIQIPYGYTAQQREDIGWAFVSYIQERSLNGQGKDQQSFPSYSAAYAKAKGVSRGDVDLNLSGDMLSQLIVLTHRSGSVTIGYPSGDVINGKVEGNRIGSYGRDPDPSRARDFLALSEDEILTVLGQFYLDEADEENERTMYELSADITMDDIEALRNL